MYVDICVLVWSTLKYITDFSRGILALSNSVLYMRIRIMDYSVSLMKIEDRVCNQTTGDSYSSYTTGNYKSLWHHDFNFEFFIEFMTTVHYLHLSPFLFGKHFSCVQSVSYSYLLYLEWDEGSKPCTTILRKEVIDLIMIDVLYYTYITAD